MTDKLKSPLKWAGGKRKIAHLILQHWNGGRIVEPFCGGCSVSMLANPPVALCSDLNKSLILFWKHAQFDGVVRNLVNDHIVANNQCDYNLARNWYNQMLATDGLALTRRKILFLRHELFYYLNMTCFNGLYRVNSSGEFNVPFGKRLTIPVYQEWGELFERLRNFVFMHTPYDEVCTEVGDFVYIDPPYDTGFASYTSDGFSWDAQERLAQWAKGLGKGRCVVISNFATSRIVKLY